MPKFILVLIFLIFFVQGAVSAEYYKWEDENGNINITNYPPPTKAAKNVKVHASDPESNDVTPSAQEPTPKEPKAAPSREVELKPGRSHDVELYVTSWCPYCKMAKEFFNSRNIYFTEYDIEKDRNAAERKKRLDPNGGVPFAVINGQQIRGFSQSAYERALQ
jgi:glutaredoxin